MLKELRLSYNSTSLNFSIASCNRNIKKWTTYIKKWTTEIFIINKQVPRYPPVYKVKDLKGEEISGVFYEEELQKIENKEIKP